MVSKAWVFIKKSETVKERFIRRKDLKFVIQETSIREVERVRVSLDPLKIILILIRAVLRLISI